MVRAPPGGSRVRPSCFRREEGGGIPDRSTLGVLPDYDPPFVEQPTFDRRGFHHHTQHPIIASDILLRPGEPALREDASKLIQYLARNRRNTLSWHMLKSIGDINQR